MRRFLLSAGAASGFMTFAALSAVAQQANPAVRPDLTGQVSSLAPEAVYDGWLSRQLIGLKVVAKDGPEIGAVRDLIVDADGRLTALIVESRGTPDGLEAVHRMPWRNVALRPLRNGVTVDLPLRQGPQHGLFQGSESVATLPREFRVTEVVGDYARLQTGYGYGYVTDVLFNRDGRMIAVLVSRDAAAGGGIYAFPYPGTTGPWDPSLSYYGLPFVTEGQAREVGLRIDPKRFDSARW